jgi:N-acetylglucosamine kinase-like BadF-type ATPase
MAYYLGLDAGGTKTDGAIARDSTVLARSSGGTIKVMRTSDEDAGEHLDNLLQSLAAESGIELKSITCTCVGLAGISVPRVSTWVREALHARVGGEVLLCGDELTALDAAFCGGPGVLVIAGTGSNIAARSASGKLIRVGGWGPGVADEGSGHWIGKQAVRAIFDSLDRDEPALLLERVQQAWDVPDLGALIDLANRTPAPDFSRLAPTVALCAEQGGAYARRVLREAGEHLGTYAVLALRRLQTLEPAGSDLPEIAYTGSVLRHIPPVREAMFDRIRQEFPSARIHEHAVDPVEGALWRARNHAQHAAR